MCCERSCFISSACWVGLATHEHIKRAESTLSRRHCGVSDQLPATARMSPHIHPQNHLHTFILMFYVSIIHVCIDLHVGTYAYIHASTYTYIQFHVDAGMHVHVCAYLHGLMPICITSQKPFGPRPCFPRGFSECWAWTCRKDASRQGCGAGGSRPQGRAFRLSVKWLG